MDPIFEIRTRLENHICVQLHEQKNYIEAVPIAKGGFPVSLENEGFQFTVTYGGGWHEHLEKAQDALNCFGFGLSERCRLKVHTAGNSEYKWTVEYLYENKWLEDSTTGLLFFPFWRQRETFYLQNQVTTKESGNDWYVT